MGAGVRRFLSEEAEAFKSTVAFNRISLAWEPNVVDFLAAEHARRQDDGLRGVNVHVQTHVREALESLTNSKMASLGSVTEKGRVSYRCRRPSQLRK